MYVGGRAGFSGCTRIRTRCNASQPDDDAALGADLRHTVNVKCGLAATELSLDLESLELFYGHVAMCPPPRWHKT